MTKGVLIALDTDKIKANLKTNRIGKKVIVYSSTASTSDIAAQYAKNKANDGLVVLAEEQSAGRGRGGNKWFGCFGKSILCSILLIESKLDVETLPLTIAAATAEAIGKCVKTEARIKWPNDVILSNKKVAGILVESKKIGKHTAFIIGIGINCHQQKDDFPPDLQKTATSIDIETGSKIDRISLIKRLLASIDHWLTIAENNEQKVIERWQKLSTQLHHRVSLVYNRRRFTGNCIGVDPRHGLILNLDSGAIRMFHSAHTTIARD
ncbi:MAG: biotin--[acetyl-CoA-carboxylase] ligase [Sedimentisphaerales bacterium]|nr:biotin--[acetyl-CoA-carboxylase] ligase [Sedimentisphaerales bacterium]